MKKSTLSIPPLPSFKRARPNATGKENVINSIPSLSSRSDNVLVPSLSKSLSNKSSTGGITTETPSRSSSSPSSSPTDLNITISSITTPTRSSSRVLRFNETLEEFFCIHQDTTSCTEEHLELCRDVANNKNGSAHDLHKWRVILDVANHTVTEISSRGRDSSSRSRMMGQDLIKLHKRAVSRFMSYHPPSTSTVPSTDPEKDDEKNLFHIWLMYAKALAQFGSTEDASKTLRHIELKKLGEKEADFYICKANFELKRENSIGQGGDAMKRAFEVVKKGYAKGATPKEELDQFLNQLDRKRAGNDDNSKTHVNVMKPILPQGSSSTTEDVEPAAMEINESTCITKSNKPIGVPKLDPLSLRNKRWLQSAKSLTGVENAEQNETSDNDDAKTYGSNVQQTVLGSSISLKSRQITSKELKESGTRAKTTSSSSSSLLGRKRPFGGGTLRGGFGGGAQRVSTNPVLDKTVDEDDDEDVETEKEDYSYLLNWVPTGPSTQAAKKVVMEGRAKKKLPAAPVSVVEKAPIVPINTFSRYRPMMEKIEETTKTAHSNHGDSTGTNSSAAYSSGSIHSQSTSSRGGETNSKATSDDTEKSEKETKSRAMSASLHAAEHSATNDSKVEGANAMKTHEDNSNGGSVVTNKSDSSSRSNESKFSSGKDERSSVGRIEARKQKESTSPTPEQVEDVNPDFLKIIRNKNILTVNGKSYVKLGVIGKGGSCKVYRVLSTDRKIVAIKLVKIGGMKRKSIEGYANEIALLKKLQGNPAIIQLYDSEVDFKRKAILLVMEAGEVDLNHVLQQQELQRSEGGNDASANMNFIRLTWQQMLSAVHCIHEERIIHGDLKPANFLFVKGKLKLIDFGIAKAIQSDDTTNIYRESQVGTLNYMSPESILDSGTSASGSRMKCGRPSDVWSLGCILYQMCYSKTPFADLTMFPKLQAIVNPNHEIDFPSTIDSAAVDAIKLCLRRKPEDRAPIVGKSGLLNEHWFLNSEPSSQR